VALNSLTWIAIYSEKSVSRPRFYYSLVLLLNTGVRSLPRSEFCCFSFYELELIPLYLLIAIWGGIQAGLRQPSFSFTQLFRHLNSVSVSGTNLASGSSSFDYQPLLAQALPGTAILAPRGARDLGSNSLVPSTPGCQMPTSKPRPRFQYSWLGVAEVGNLWVAAVWFRFVSRSMGSSSSNACNQ